MLPREYSEQLERQTLSPRAALAAESRGREREEIPCNFRTDFQRDRDRIIHCKAFRRLKNKTQVFFSPEGDHYRTRLTHTLAVSQVARAIARTLSLNEDLTEAIALGHDLGHTPFGHAGERILSSLNKNGFSHNVQSGRVVDCLENDGKGLNLTREVVDGIINHTMKCNPQTLEGRAVSIADRIAYINHDIDDAVQGGFITVKDLPKNTRKYLGETSRDRINVMLKSIYEESEGKNVVQMQKDIDQMTMELRTFMFERVYSAKTFRDEENRANKMITALYEYYYQDPSRLPEFFVKMLDENDIDTVLCDYISGMSDIYAVKMFSEIFVPKNWKL
jgi:dGTPase